jgi:tyrosine-specific transport protein
MDKTFFKSSAILIGSVIGAGVLGIPYVVSKAGFLNGIIVILAIAVITTLLLLYLGEVTLRTKGIHQLTGYAERYLGKKGKFLMLIGMIIGIYGALLAYIIGIGKTLSALIPGPSILYSTLVFILLAYIIYKGLKAVESSELYAVSITFFIVILISILSYKNINLENLQSTFSLSKLFIPYGVILFAFIGFSAIPELREELKGKEKLLKKSIITSLIIISFLYILFSFVTVAVTGSSTTEIATIGLGNSVGPIILILGNLFALFAMSTSFLAIGLALKEMYIFDYEIGAKKSWALTCLIPFILFLLLKNFTSFTKVLSISGVLTGGLSGLLILFMFIKAKKLGNRTPEYSLNKNYLIISIIALVFILGVVFGLN